MRSVLRAVETAAISSPAQTDSDEKSTAQTGSEDHGWFSEPAQVLLGSDPGLALSVLTGIPERTCYRYTSGERGVQGWIIYQLLRSAHGRQWHAALMDGCQEPWWIEMQADIAVGAAARNAMPK